MAISEEDRLERYLFLRDVLKISTAGTDDEVMARVRHELTTPKIQRLQTHLREKGLVAAGRSNLKTWCTANYHKGHPIRNKRLPNSKGGNEWTLWDGVLWLRKIGMDQQIQWDAFSLKRPDPSREEPTSEHPDVYLPVDTKNQTPWLIKIPNSNIGGVLIGYINYLRENSGDDMPGNKCILKWLRKESGLVLSNKRHYDSFLRQFNNESGVISDIRRDVYMATVKVHCGIDGVPESYLTGNNTEEVIRERSIEYSKDTNVSIVSNTTDILAQEQGKVMNKFMNCLKDPTKAAQLISVLQENGSKQSVVDEVNRRVGAGECCVLENCPFCSFFRDLLGDESFDHLFKLLIEFHHSGTLGEEAKKRIIHEDSGRVKQPSQYTSDDFLDQRDVLRVVCSCAHAVLTILALNDPQLYGHTFMPPEVDSHSNSHTHCKLYLAQLIMEKFLLQSNKACMFSDYKLSHRETCGIDRHHPAADMNVRVTMNNKIIVIETRKYIEVSNIRFLIGNVDMFADGLVFESLITRPCLKMIHQLWHRLWCHREKDEMIKGLFNEFPFREINVDGEKFLEYTGNATDLGLSLKDIAKDGTTFISLPRSDELKNRIEEVLEIRKRAIVKMKNKGIPDDEIEDDEHFGSENGLFATMMESEEPPDEVEYDEKAVLEEGDGDDDNDEESGDDDNGEESGGDDEETGGEMDVDQGGVLDDEGEMMDVDADFDVNRDAWFRKTLHEYMDTDVTKLPCNHRILNLPHNQEMVFWEMWNNQWEQHLESEEAALVEVEEAARVEVEEAAREEEAGQDAPAQLMEVDQEEADEEGDAEGEGRGNVSMTTAFEIAGTTHVSRQGPLPKYQSHS